MKSKTTIYKLFFLSILFILVFIGKGFSQENTYFCFLKNINYTDCKTLEFEVWLEWRGSNTQKFQALQAGIDFNYVDIANGGIITGAFVAGSAEPSLPPAQQSPNWNINQTSKQIRLLAGIATPESSAISCPALPGMKIGKFRMSNTVNFTAQTTPNFEWSFATGSSTKTQTKLTMYLNGSALGTDITDQSSHYREDNPAVNADCAGTCPITATIVQNVPPTCLGGSNGNVFVAITNGVNTSSGLYSLDGQAFIAFITNPFQIDNLSAGNHNVFVTTNTPCSSNLLQFIIEQGADPEDNDLCTIDVCDPITGPSHSGVDINDNDPCTVDACDPIKGISHTEVRPIINISSNLLSCYGGSACIFVEASGDFPPYNGTGTYCGYGRGSYTFDIIDSRGCVTTSAPIEIIEPLKLTLTTFSTPSDNNDGTASVFVDGGTPEYSYLWTPGGQTTATATGLYAGIYCVQVTDLYGCTATKCVSVNFADICDLTGPMITGPSGVCKKQTGVVYCASPNPYANSYMWTLPPGVTAVGPTNGPCITLKFSSKFKGGFICTKASLWCGTGANGCINVVLLTKKPNTPGIISGPSSLCPNQTATYSIASVPNASNYIWKVDGHMLVDSGQGKTSITVQTASNFNGGHVKVQAINCIGTSGTKSINVTKNAGCRVSNNTTADKIENVSDKFSAYPNPTSGNLTVNLQTKTKSIATLKLIDIIGNVVLKDFIITNENNNTKDLDLSHLAHGMYFLIVEMEGVETQSMRIVVD